MDANATRLRKEIRPLFWPWCAITLAGAVPFFHPPDEIAWIPPLAFLLGIPLLATISYGSEFQHRTFSLLLSQPVSRGRIWRDKLLVTLVAALSAVLLFALSSGREVIREDPLSLYIWGAWAVGIVASATFWTLLSRSTVGGVILNISVQGFVIIAGLYGLNAAASTSAHRRVSALLATAFVGYAGAMLWLGWRKLARVQATGSMAGDDLLVTGPDVLPQAFAAWFRCRPRGATLNLIGKELRLLRPVWIFTLLSALGWTALSVCEFWGRHKPYDRFPVASAVAGVACAAIIALLAGSISLGEEKTSGRHAWHMTLPVPAWRQWIVKLVTALFAGLVCAGVLPLLLIAGGRYLFPEVFSLVDKDFQLYWLFWTVLLTAAGFWCACAANGTVPAVVWVFPTLIAAVVAPASAMWISARCMWPVYRRLVSLTNFRVAITIAHATRLIYRFFWQLPVSNPYFRELRDPELMIAFLPTLAAALILSYRLFRSAPTPGVRPVAWRLTFLVLPAFVCTLLWSGWCTFAEAAAGQAISQVSQTEMAIRYLLAERPDVQAGLPLHLTVQDLRSAGYINSSPETLRWLGDAQITVVPLGPLPAPQQLNTWYFVATVRLPNRTELTLAEKPTNDPAAPIDYDYRVRWPGAAHDEPLLKWWQRGLD